MKKVQTLTKPRADMEKKYKDFARKALASRGEALSKVNLKKLDATLTPLKEHVGHFENELKQRQRAIIDDRAALKAEITRLSRHSRVNLEEGHHGACERPQVGSAETGSLGRNGSGEHSRPAGSAGGKGVR